jgi:hypothetical protein
MNPLAREAAKFLPVIVQLCGNFIVNSLFCIDLAFFRETLLGGGGIYGAAKPGMPENKRGATYRGFHTLHHELVDAFTQKGV